MKYIVAICDDDANQREYLTEIVGNWAGKNHCLAEVRQYPTAEAFLFEYGEKKDFDILLLDVEMPGMNGTSLAKEVRRDNKAVQIIFITGFYEYFSDGFDVSALHYLIKPVGEEKLFPVLDKAVNNLSSHQRSVLVSTSEAEVKIPLNDILYVEAENVYVAVHTPCGKYQTRCSLAKFAEQLDETFFKVHRSYVVGLKDIIKITRTEITMSNGDRIPISRGMYDRVHAALVKYL
ncbi:MAG: LytTR family DNA-binding domain-containing protein [Butyrivibrio sp.]|nr:LytTR family DNA-binding domain-containing protein [Acetatifactor muris]MCM1559097.1 LytTR family DNA-binding domain-containing protein [Butyrivibrio sp.]